MAKEAVAMVKSVAGQQLWWRSGWGGAMALVISGQDLHGLGASVY